MKSSSLPRRSTMNSKSWGKAVAGALALLSLVASGAFSGSEENTVASASSSSGTVNLDALSAEQKRDLLRRKQQFEQLSGDEQNKLRELHHSLSAEPDAPQLTAVM